MHEGREAKASEVPEKVEDKIGSSVGFAHNGREGGDGSNIYL